LAGTFIGQIFLSSGRTEYWSKKVFASGGIYHLCISKRNKPNPEENQQIRTLEKPDPDQEKPM